MDETLFYIMGHDDDIQLFAHTEADIDKTYDMASDWFRNGPPPLENWRKLFRPITHEEITNNATLRKFLEASLKGYGRSIRMPDSIKVIVAPLLEDASKP